MSRGRQFAKRTALLIAKQSAIVRAIQTDLAHRAGLTASTGARTGVVTLIQRFGSALNLNVHLHMLILDGVYTLEQNSPRFHRVGAPDAPSLERLLNRLVRRIVRRLTHDGLLIDDPEQPWLDLEPSDTAKAQRLSHCAGNPVTPRRSFHRPSRSAHRTADLGAAIETGVRN